MEDFPSAYFFFVVVDVTAVLDLHGDRGGRRGAEINEGRNRNQKKKKKRRRKKPKL